MLSLTSQKVSCWRVIVTCIQVNIIINSYKLLTHYEQLSLHFNLLIFVCILSLYFKANKLCTTIGEGKLRGEEKLWFQTGADGARLASSGKSI